MEHLRRNLMHHRKAWRPAAKPAWPRPDPHPGQSWRLGWAESADAGLPGTGEGVLPIHKGGCVDMGGFYLEGTVTRECIVS